MDGTSKYKVPNGKLVIIKLSYSDKIEKLQILGDFFLYPEESLSLIEDSLIGLPINVPKEDLARKVSEIVKKERIDMIGLTPDAVAEAIIMAIK